MGSIYVIHKDGQDQSCGLVCMKNTAGHCNVNLEALPPELTAVITTEELLAFAKKINNALDDTTVPVWPCYCLHLIIPLSPVCYQWECDKRRKAALYSIVYHENTRIKGRGVYWEVPFSFDPASATTVLVVLKSNDAVELKAPQRVPLPPAPGSAASPQQQQQDVQMLPVATATPIPTSIPVATVVGGAGTVKM